MGIVPDNEMSRQYRDLLGMVNQRIAAVAHEVVLMVSGIPIEIKGGDRG
jgi:adenosylcobinamide kinase/adenosylcobinamide-phosphate guanylyltransferase